MLRNKRNLVLGIGVAMLAALLVVPAGITASAQSQEVETGYLVSLRGHTLAISNVAMGGGGGGGAQPQMRMMVRGSDGQRRELTGEALEKAKQRMRAGGGTSISVNVDSSGNKTYSVMGPDGKTKTLTEEEFKEMEKKMEQGGGHTVRMPAAEDGSAPRRVMVRSSSASESEDGSGKVMKRTKVSFTKFEITDDTEIPDGIERGTQIKVHYRIEGDRKIATKIEAVI